MPETAVKADGATVTLSYGREPSPHEFRCLPEEDGFRVYMPAASQLRAALSVLPILATGIVLLMMTGFADWSGISPSIPLRFCFGGLGAFLLLIAILKFRRLQQQVIVTLRGVQLSVNLPNGQLSDFDLRDWDKVGLETPDEALETVLRRNGGETALLGLAYGSHRRKDLDRLVSIIQNAIDGIHRRTLPLGHSQQEQQYGKDLPG